MKKQPWYAFVLLGLLLAGAAYFLYLKPKQAELKVLRAERIKIESEVANLREKKQELDKIEKELSQLGAALAELEVIIPRRKEIGDILRNIQQMAYDAHLDVMRFVPDREINRDFFTEQPIPIQVVGTYHDLGLFFDRLLHFPRIFHIEDFSIKSLPAQTDAATISALFTAKTYFFIEESAAKKPEAGKPAKVANEK
jgi:type IV pilus assembly protein PilO